MQRDLFENTPVPRAYLKLAVPVVLAMLLSVVYNMVDTWFISLTGDTNLLTGILAVFIVRSILRKNNSLEGTV